MENPILALIPAAYGTKFYSILPSDGVGDFDFSRGSAATRINPEGLIETITSGKSRLNYPLVNGVVKGCPHYLLEPSRTNLITYSEDFTQSSWVKQSAGVASAPVVTSNYSISPDGTLNADRVIFNIGGGSTSSDFSQINDPVTAPIGGVTSSVYIKSNTTSNYTMSLVNASGTTSIISVTTEWQRFEVNATTTTTASSFRLRLRGSESTSDFADVSVWGAQIEQGSYPTSYITTNGTPVTRLAETANGAGDANLFNITEGTFFVDLFNFDSLNSSVIGLSNGTDAQKITLLFEPSLTRVRTFSSGGVFWYYTLNYNQRNKILVTFKLNEYKTYINGVLVSTDTNVTVPTGMDRLNFSDKSATTLFFEGEVYDTRVYDRVLTEAEAIKLTT